jgi:hypothetical protein
VNTHNLFVENKGRAPAHELTVTHKTLEGIDVVVFPAVNYRRETLPGGEVAIIFPVFIPSASVRIQYLAVNRVTENIHALTAWLATQ